MITGQQLFRMYVAAALCAGEYRWDALSPAMQERWHALAAELLLVQ